MKPQHIVIAILPFARVSTASSTNSAAAFVGWTTPGGSFTRCHPRAFSVPNDVATSLRMDVEGNAIDERIRLRLQDPLLQQKQSLEGYGGRQPPSDAASTAPFDATHDMPWRNSIGNREGGDDDNALIYMPFWEYQMKFVRSNLTNLCRLPCTCALGRTDFTYNVNVQKGARIVNACYTSDEYRKIRMTYYDAGDKSQVFSLVWYPDPSFDLPVLGVNALAFGSGTKRKLAACVDFQPLHELEERHAATYEHLLRPIRSACSNALRGEMSTRFYDDQRFFSDQMLFGNFQDKGLVGRELFPTFQRYVETHVDLVRRTTPNQMSEGEERVLDQHAAYDAYFADREPAKGVFASMFGKSWAEDFVHNFLFSLSQTRTRRTELGTNLQAMP